MRFSMTHKFIEGAPVVFTEDTAPAWLVSPENKWFFDAHVARLKVGGHTETEFRRIIRIA